MAYGAATDEPVFRWTSGYDLAYYHQDAIGNVTTLSDTSGIPVETYRYDVFGQPSLYDPYHLPRSASFFGNPLLFTAREYLPHASLYQYRHRSFSPSLGRFLEFDPLSFSAGDPNLLRYVGNSPTNWMDPLGLQDAWHSQANNVPIRRPSNPANPGDIRTAKIMFGFTSGIVIGTIGSIAISAAAPAAVTGLTQIGVPIQVARATVTTSLMATGTVGAISLGYDTYSNATSGNWEAAAFNIGLFAGGSLYGIAGGGKFLAESIGGCPTSAKPGLFGDSRLGFDPKYPNSSILGWIASGPTPQMGGAAAAFTIGGAGSMTIEGWVSNE